MGRDLGRKSNYWAVRKRTSVSVAEAVRSARWAVVVDCVTRDWIWTWTCERVQPVVDKIGDADNVQVVVGDDADNSDVVECVGDTGVFHVLSGEFSRWGVPEVTVITGVTRVAGVIGATGVIGETGLVVLASSAKFL